jgi:FkbM family methyltransferase
MSHFVIYGDVIVHCSRSGWDGTGPDDSKMYTLESLMQQNGHKHIDILKIDIEGWEFETLDTVLKPYLDTGRPLP